MPLLFVLFFFNDTATTEIYTLSLHDALPISLGHSHENVEAPDGFQSPRNVGHDSRARPKGQAPKTRDRKSTRLNSSHANISYAVFCLKKKKKKKIHKQHTRKSPVHQNKMNIC